MKRLNIFIQSQCIKSGQVHYQTNNFVQKNMIVLSAIILCIISLIGCTSGTSESDQPNEEVVSSSDCISGNNKIALIIAIGNYASEGDLSYITPATRGWMKINSNNDIPLITAALKAQGFCDDNIKVIEDQEATKEGIKTAIQTYLIDKSNPGDIAFLHFSGHGQQIMDDNGDEADGWDEALIPHDAAVKFVSQVYEGERHLRDDELGRLLAELRMKLGRDGQLVATIDACHSGTATRGIGSSRGTAIKMAPDDYNPSVSNIETSTLIEFNLNSRGDMHELNLAPYVIISGASANELNYETFDQEGKKVGSLSYAVSRALTKADQHTTFEGLFDRIKLDMANFASRQTPQIEGDVNMLVFNGETQKLKEYYKVKEMLDDKMVVINTGHLAGLFEGTTLAFYDIDADTSKAQPKALGTIVNAYTFESDVELDRSLSKEDAMSAWAYVINKNFGNILVKVKLDVQGKEPFTNELKKKLAEQKFIKLVESDPDIQIEMNNEFTATRGGDHLQITTDKDYVYYNKPVNYNYVDVEVNNIIRQTLSFAQAKYLRTLELTNKDLEVTLEFVPVEVERAGRSEKITRRLDIKEKKNKQGIIEFKLEDRFIFKITNRGTKDAYYCILDIQPDNVVNALVPFGNRTADEYLIKAGESKELTADIYSLGKPLGLESLKLIATEQPIDLRPLIASRGAKTRASQNPFESLLSYSYQLDQAGKRGAMTQSVPPASGHISTIFFKIVE